MRFLSIIFIFFISFCESLNLSYAQQKPINIDLFVMSQCPYGVLAENSMIELRKEFKEAIQINLYFIAQEEKGEFRSLHGEQEVEEDIRQLVILKYWPDKFWDYLRIRNTNYFTPAWQSAALTAGLDIEKLNKLTISQEAKDLFRKNIQKAEELKVMSSPTIYINNELYSSGLGLPSLKLAICKRLKAKSETLCSGLPECFEDRDCGFRPKKEAKCQDAGTIKASCIFPDAPKIELMVLNSQDCLEEPDISFLLADFQKLYPGLEVKKQDVSSNEGNKLLTELGIKVLPAIIFDANLAKTDNFQTNINQGVFLRLKDPRYYLLSPLILKPTLYLDKEPRAETLDLFLMSHCPSGIEAENTLIKRLKDKPDFKLNIHYIVKKDNQGKFFSSHGEEELREDIEQIVMRYYLSADKFLDYILCRNQAIKKGEEKRNWQACAEKLGLNPQSIWEFAYEKNVEFLNKEFAFPQEFQIESSPTFIWENKVKIANPPTLRKIKKFQDLKISVGSCR